MGGAVISGTIIIWGAGTKCSFNGGDMMDKYVEASNWWYLVPLFFSILGGLIAYTAIRKEDPEKAGSCLFLGGLMFMVNIFAALILMG